MVSRGTWVFYEGEFLPRSEVTRRKMAKREHARSSLPCPHVRRDEMEPFISHIDGKTVFDSKSAWERECKEKGFTIIGEQRDVSAPELRAKPTDTEIKDAQADVALAFQMHEQGYVAPPLETSSDFAVAPARDGNEYIRTDSIADVVD